MGCALVGGSSGVLGEAEAGWVGVGAVVCGGWVGVGFGVAVTCGLGAGSTVMYVVAVEAPYDLLSSNVAVMWYVPGTGGFQAMP